MLYSTCVVPVQVSLSCLCNLGKTDKMWPLLEQKVNAVRCDLLFTEDINRRMRVPNRLTVANSFSPVDEEPMSEGVSPSFPIHIPVRISLAGNVLGFLGCLKFGRAL